MKLFIYLYYLFYVLSGGFRHYSFDIIFFKSISGELVLTTPRLISILELVLMLLAFVILLMPLKKMLHLIFFLLLFFMDLYFQNQVNFMTCFILPHFTPLLFYLLLRYENYPKQKNLVIYGAMLSVAVGYLSSFSSKIFSMWFNYSDTVIFSYLLEFYEGYSVPSLAASWLLTIKSSTFWKLMDYFVLAFQGSFILLFFKKNLFVYISGIAAVFHLGILAVLGIGVVFYLYVLFYSLVIFASTENSNLFPHLDNKWFDSIKNIALALLLMLFVFSAFDVRFFNALLPLSFYIYAEYFYYLICLTVFIFTVKQQVLSPVFLRNRH